MATNMAAFFRQHPIFTRQTLKQVMYADKERENTLKNSLAQHLQQGHIIRIKRGLFASIPYGEDPASYPVNPYLIASKLTEDAVIGYHTALALYGFAYSASYRFIYVTQAKPKPFEFRGVTYQPAFFPTALVSRGQTHCYVNKVDVQGIDVFVTSKERTVVDVMDRPLLGGGWEEIWRSLDVIERLKIKDIIDYTLMLENATTAAKVGFYLEQRQAELNVEQEQLSMLQQHRPNVPLYMDHVTKTKCRLIQRWNLMVPESLINRDWEETLNWEPKL